MRSICISLSRRSDKRAEVIKEFDKMGITPFWYIPKAVPPKKGDRILSCRDSHFECMETMKYFGVFMITEDDMLCLTDNPKKDLEGMMNELPECWDALWLGSNLQKPLKRYSDSLYRLNGGGWTTHAIVWNNQNGVIDYILKHKDDIFKLDVFLADVVQEKFECYITYPMFATQKQWDSDIMKSTDASAILRNYNKNTNER